MPEYDYITYETLSNGRVVRIMLDRPDTRNAQNRGLLVELDDAFLRAERDDQARVVILGGNGPMFSSGHDMGSAVAREEFASHSTMLVHGGSRAGAERMMLQEWHYYFQNTLRWRNLRKITIAEVHGPVYSAGLMLAWCCDLLVAAEDTTFADVVSTRLGMAGVEYFAHPWEFGPRKTKELMLTGDSLDADEAYRLGMVSKVFPREELAERTLEFAERIANVPTVAAMLVKESVNQTMDAMGFTNALQSCFSIHQLNHAHWASISNGERQVATAEHDEGIQDWRTAPPVQTAEKSTVGGA